MERTDARIILLDFRQSFAIRGLPGRPDIVSSLIHTYTLQSRHRPVDCTILQTAAFFYWL
jgi:hypothetical protein